MTENEEAETGDETPEDAGDVAEEEAAEAQDAEDESETEEIEDESEAQDAEDESEAEGDEDEDGGLEAGDFVELSYTARTVESDQLVDTTDEEVAKEEGVYEEDRSFGPRTIVIGEGHVFSTVDDELIGKAVGDAGTVTVPAEDAFGEADPDEVRTVSVEKIPEDDRYPGAHVTVEGEHGHVETVVGGRARVDFNHPLAGQDIEYDYEIVGEVEDRVKQAKGLFGMFVDAEPEMWIDTDEVEEEVTVFPDDDEYDPEKAPEPEVDDEEAAEGDDADGDGEEPEPQPYTELRTVEKESLYIESTSELAMNQQWLFSKQQIGRQLIDRLGVDRVVVQELIDYTAGGMGGMMGGGGGDVEEALEDADVDADEIVEELETE